LSSEHCHDRADAGAEARSSASPPDVRFTDEALTAALARLEASGHEALRLVVDKQHSHELFADAPRPGDTTLSLGELSLLLDRKTFERADGIHVDYVRADGLEGFVLHDPEAPSRVSAVSPDELGAWLRGGKSVWLFDVRLDLEAEVGPLYGGLYRGAHRLDDDGRELLQSLQPDTPVVFLAVHRERAWAAAGHACHAGFSYVFACATV